MNLVQEKNTVLGFLDLDSQRNTYSSLYDKASLFLKEQGLPYKTEEYKFTALAKKIEQNLINITFCKKRKFKR
jgi:hypothetical protein